MSDKQFKLIENIVALDGVKSAEAYQKSTGENVWYVLVNTDNGRLVEGTLACKDDLALFEEYLRVVVSIGERDFMSHYFSKCPNEGDADNEQN